MFIGATLLFSQLLGPQSNLEKLQHFLEAFDDRRYDVVEQPDFRIYADPMEIYSEDEDLKRVLREFLRAGQTYVDIGAKDGKIVLDALSLVGNRGRAIAFEPNPQQFRKLYWNLILNGIDNAFIFCHDFDQGEMGIGRVDFEGISVIRLDKSGREDLFLQEANALIQKYRPVLIMNMMGGIAIDHSDRFVKKEYEERVERLEQMGYKIRNLRNDLYVAVPN